MTSDLISSLLFPLEVRDWADIMLLKDPTLKAQVSSFQA